MDQDFLQAFVEVVREQIARKNKVKIEGIGSFRVEHKKQYQKQYDNGRVVMMPPRDTISFKPEN
ncbi:HU family DNA-binding protein [Fodinibius sediminis]|uniref:DNA-binding protein n=1 Tax=Fodinibius sediminis TaxID=1214077 RepID=A0A521AQH1_9BACT|nr:HU family DNA-binding protein [Fodinibius sediminis]SMO36900.1 DNA-binding protein [Fodinibius sediminis]